MGRLKVVESSKVPSRDIWRSNLMLAENKQAVEWVFPDAEIWM